MEQTLSKLTTPWIVNHSATVVNVQHSSHALCKQEGLPTQ